MCAWDFVDTHVISERSFKARWGKRLAKMRRWAKRSPAACHSLPHTTTPTPNSITYGGVEEKHLPATAEEHSSANLGRVTSQSPSISAMLDSTNRIPGTLPLEAAMPESPFQPLQRDKSSSSLRPPLVHGHGGRTSTNLAREPSCASSTLSAGPRPTPKLPLHKRALRILSHIPTATWSVIAGLLFSLIQPMKALMVDTDGWTGSRMPNAPDDNPPLFFLLDTAAYLGALTVPLGLMLLGSSFARLKVRLPLQ